MSLLIPTLFLFLVFLFQLSWKEGKFFNSPFECGMEPFSEGRVNLYMHFFMVSILFVVFDLELAAILPLVLTLVGGVVWNFVWVVVLVVLLLGLLLEVELSSLEWKE